MAEVSGNGCFKVGCKFIPFVWTLGHADGGVGDADEEPHEGDALRWGAIEISDFVPPFERSSERDEGRVVAGRREPTDWNPRVVDEVEVVHEILKVEVFLETVGVGFFGGGFFISEAEDFVIVEGMSRRSGVSEFNLWSVIGGDGQKGIGNVLFEPVGIFREASLDEVTGDSDGIEVKSSSEGETELSGEEGDAGAVDEFQSDFFLSFDRRRFEKDDVASRLDAEAGFFALDITNGAGEDVALLGGCSLIGVLMLGVGEEAGDGGVGIWVKFVGSFETTADFAGKAKGLCFRKVDRCLPKGERWIDEAMGRELGFNFL